MQELAQVSLFSKLNPQELQKLGAIAKKQNFGPGSVVFFEGDRSDSLYVILGGSVKIYQTTNDGREKILKTMGKGEIFGEFAVIDGQPRSAAVATLEKTELLSITHRDFRGFATGSPEILWKVLESLCERLRKTTEDVTDIAFRDVPYRLLKALIELAETSGQKHKDGVKIVAHVSSQDLANRVAANPQRVTRLMGRFQDESLIQVEDDGLVVPDMKALKKALEISQDWG
jgi:CRP/FNR family cyclic AMP-dependent transcriptional regulator